MEREYWLRQSRGCVSFWWWLGGEGSCLLGIQVSGTVVWGWGGSWGLGAKRRGMLVVMVVVLIVIVGGWVAGFICWLKCTVWSCSLVLKAEG